MLGEFASHADLYAENAIGLMVRRTRTELVETIERSKSIYTLLSAKFHEQEKMWRFRNGARLRFAYLERDADADAYQGHSYTRVYIEEAGTFPSDKPILKLMATLRSGAGVPVGIRLTGNPGGPGQHWVKARYIDPNPTGWKVHKRAFENPWSNESVERDWVYIPSRLIDNKYLGPDYIAGLQMVGSPELVRAWLEGDWNVIEGAFFDSWSRRNIVAPFTIPKDWLRFRSMDWGFAAPFSVGWWAVASDNYRHAGGVIPRGCMVRYREWYGAAAPNTGLRMTAEDVALGIKAREQGDNVSYGVIDPAAFAEDGGPSIAERMMRAGGLNFRPADNKRVAQRGAVGGWDQMRARIKGTADGPMMVVFGTCKDFIRTIPVLQHDPDRAEDLDTESEDHVADEARYAAMSRPWIMPATPKEKPRRDRWDDDPDEDEVNWKVA